MADIEKMREIFEEVLKEYESAEDRVISDRGNSTDFNNLQESVSAYRTRFNEAVMANQSTVHNITVNVAGHVISEQDLLDKVKEMIEREKRNLSLRSAS